MVEEDKLFVVCNDDFSEDSCKIKVFGNKESAMDWIDTFEEKIDKDFVKLNETSGQLYEHNDNDGYESVELFEIPNSTENFHIFETWYDTGYGGGNTMHYADSYKRILKIAKEEIFGQSEWIKERYEEYCDDMPDEDSQQIIDAFDKNNLDPKHIYISLLENGEYDFKDVSGETCGWKIIKKKIRT